MIRTSRHALLISGLMLAYCTSLPTVLGEEKSTAKAVLSREDVGKILVQARKAMIAGKLAEAESLLAKAEAAKISYPVLNFGDTPTKVRRDLNKLVAKQPKTTQPNPKQAPSDAVPSSLTGPRYTETPSPTVKQDPFKGQPETVMTPSLSVQQPSTMVPPKVADLSTASGNGMPQHVAVPTTNALTNPVQQAVAQLPGGTDAPPVVKPATAIDLTLPGVQPEIRTAQAPTSGLTPLPVAEQLLPQPDDAFSLLQGGENALRKGDRNAALEMFRAAYGRKNELDIVSQQRLQDHLQMLSVDSAPKRQAESSDSLINAASSSQAVLARQLSADVGKKQAEAARLRATDPQGALSMLQETGRQVTDSDLGQNMKTQLLRRLDLSIAETKRFIRDNGADIELEQANRTVLEDIDRQREVKQQVRERLAELVDQYNQLRDEQRYAEMEVVAKRAYDMAPNEPVARQIWESAKFIRRSMLNQEIADLSEQGVYDTFTNIQKVSSETLSKQTQDITFPSTWDELTKDRIGSRERGARRSARELEIQQKLRTQILPNYDEMALSEVAQSLSELTGVNIYLDPRGLGQEGVRSDTPVSLKLGQEISLQSALSLILEPLHLTYVIKNEVLKVTSEQLRDGDVEVQVYNVADLVVPIPNFVPTSGMGLQGLINDAYEALPNVRRTGAGPVTYVPGQVGLDAAGVPANPNVLQQQLGGATSSAGSAPLSAGPGGLGGAAAADFDSLIDLIVSTVEHDSWMENGTGDGEIQPFPTNLSLVISQTQRVHEQIADLLEQLRRLQDLQVTIEVRFIRLTDSFFERIGIDFDFNIEDGGGTAVSDLNTVGATFEPPRQSATVGITGGTSGITDPLPDFSVDLDVPFRNSSFGLTTPQFGTPMTVGEFGFAILSDIEAFFLINASQGDTRANVLQAPKVTLFNGQQAIVVDTSFTPFVISVIPVVGEFAAAQQPVIVVLSEGTMMTVQAVVSDDRRYVRLTLVPFFSQIGNVDTFTFEGSETTTTTSNTTDDNGDGVNNSDANTSNVVRSGTTVQLPTFEVISVATTVSVPDGGTVLLGGIKRLREGRNEFGVPLLSKVPYIDRLFRNVGIGRETDSLMMMVTPHIIIQEEEEERLGIAAE
ncbi:MAG: hypothetical protein AAGD11_20460 [Planctomycetota bacterium]